MKKLENTKKINTGSILRAYKKGFGYSKLTVLENSDYYLAIVANVDFFNMVQEGDVVEMYLWVEDVASYEFKLPLIGRIVSGDRILFFGHTDIITRHKDRKCLTAQVDIPIKFFYFDPQDSDKRITSEDIMSHTGTVILLSDREAVIRSDVNIDRHRFLKGQITINQETIELVGTIDLINNSKRIYNLLFTGMQDKHKNKILEYIFSMYRE